MHGKLRNDISVFPSLLVAFASKDCDQASLSGAELYAGEQLCTESLESDDVSAQNKNTADVSPCDLDRCQYGNWRTNLAALMQQFIKLNVLSAFALQEDKTTPVSIKGGVSFRELRLNAPERNPYLIWCFLHKF